MIFVYSKQPHPRISYTLEVLLADHLGVEWTLLHDWSAFDAIEQPKWIYGAAPEGTLSKLQLPAAPWLCTETIPGLPKVVNRTPIELQWDGIFDPLAATFYLLSRAEEYQPRALDTHGRFSAKASLASQHGFLQRPVIHEWARQLGQGLQAQYPKWKFQLPSYSFFPTYDIDMAWAYRARYWGGLPGAAKQILSGRIHQFFERLHVWAGREPDPFDVFDWLHALHEFYGLTAHYFWLLGDRGAFDPNPPHNHPRMKKLIPRITNDYPIGIHPSYASFGHVDRVRTERERLEKLSNQKIDQSRQHYLLLRFPETYRNLLAAGICSDYSMGFADDWGFRAGTNLPHYWYDLEQNIQTNLKVHPFVVMDRTLKDYLGLGPERASEVLTEIVTTLRTYGGPLATLWHNSSFAPLHGWAGWKVVYSQLLEQAH